MRKLLLVFSLLFSLAAFSQNDKIYLHNGKVVDGSVVKVAEFVVIFKYAGEDAEQTISKYGVDKIIYGKSKREEKVTDKVNVSSKDDWEKVVILEDKTQISGLQKVDEIRGKTSLINYRSAAGGDKKSEEKLKKAAAEMGCQFILMTGDKDAGMQSSGSRGLGGTQSMKKGVAYKY